jgi:RNA-directed DNA polymerase
VSLWDKVREFVVGAPAWPDERMVRDAMLSFAAKGKPFQALDVAQEVTASKADRTADDLRRASDLARRLFADGLLTPLGYSETPGGVWEPKAAPVSAAQASVSAKITAMLDRAATRQESFAEAEIAAELVRTTAPEFGDVLAHVSALAATLLPPRGYTQSAGKWRFDNRSAPATSAAAPAPSRVAPVAPAPTPRAPAPPQNVNAYAANPEVLGLSPDEFRKRALRINPYRTAWIGRVDTIPPQSDERTALIDRGLILRGLLTKEQLAQIHTVGDQWIRFHDADRLAQAVAFKTADEAIARLREAKAKRRAERKQLAVEKEKARVEAVAKRRAEDIIYLGRGVSKGLVDRRSNLELLQRSGLPAWSAPADVARGLGLTLKQLRWLCFHAEATTKTHYVYFEVPKRSGGKRLLSAPHALLKTTQRRVLDELLSKLPLEPEAHGFVKGRSTVTNATAHLGQGVVLNVDLKDFFPTVTFRRVRGLFESFGYSPAVATVLGLLCTEAPRRKVRFDDSELWVAVGERCLPQGAPTSPAIANLISRKLDRRLRGRLGTKGWVYTRYADDLSFSKKTFTRADLGFVHASIRHVVEDEGFALNPKKGRAQGQGGRQDVTGVVVNVKPGVPRDELRRLRALLHQAAKGGLEAQNREKVPNFRQVLEGKIAYVMMIDRAKGLKFKAALDAVR